MPPAKIDSPSYFFTPRRFDLLSRPFLEVLCPFLCAIFYFSFSFLDFGFVAGFFAAGFAAIGFFAAVFGFAYGGAMTLFSPTIAELFGLRSHGVILATAACIGGIGAAVGPVMGGYIFDVTGKYSLAFMICAIIAIIGLILSLLLKPVE